MSRRSISLLLLPLLLAGLASCEFPTNEELIIPSLSSPVRRQLVRPVLSSSDQLNISVDLTLIDAEVDEAHNKVTLGGWLYTSWTDHLVSWGPSNITISRVFPNQLWTPDLSVYNRVPVGSKWVSPMPAVVYPSGKVIYVVPVSFTVRCQRSQDDDHDRITCPFKLGSWTHNVNEMDLVPRSSTLNTDSFLSNGRWTVESSSVTHEEKIYDCCPESYPYLLGEVVFKPQRS